MIQYGRIPREHPLSLLEGPLLPRLSHPTQLQPAAPPSPPSPLLQEAVSHPALGMSFHSLTFVLSPLLLPSQSWEPWQQEGGGQGDRVA